MADHIVWWTCHSIIKKFLNGLGGSIWKKSMSFEIVVWHWNIRIWSFFHIVYDFSQMTLLLSQNNASDIKKFSASTILSCVDLFEIYANGFNCYVENFRFIRCASDTFKSIFGPYHDKKTSYNSVPEHNSQPLITTAGFILWCIIAVGYRNSLCFFMKK